MSRKKPNLQLPFYGVHLAEWKRIYSDSVDYFRCEVMHPDEESVVLTLIRDYITCRLAEIDNARRIDDASLLFDPVSATT